MRRSLGWSGVAMNYAQLHLEWSAEAKCSCCVTADVVQLRHDREQCGKDDPEVHAGMMKTRVIDSICPFTVGIIK